jgi:transposase
MDVDKRKLVVVIMTAMEILRRITLPYDSKNLLTYVGKNFPGKKAVYIYEAGPTGYGLYQDVKNAGELCFVAVPSMIPKAPGARVKTNRLDAEQLGFAFRSGNLKYVRVPSRLYIELRHLTHLQQICRRRVTSAKLRIKSLLLFEGLTFPGQNWSIATVSALQSKLPDLATGTAITLRAHLKDLSDSQAELNMAKKEVQQFSLANPELNNCMKYLLSIPGVGWTIGSYILARLGGWQHLSRVKGTVHFFGVAPRENSTGEKINRGSITAIGDPIARALLIQAAWIAIRKDPQMRAIYCKIFNTNPKPYRSQKAIVAVARVLAARIHAVLRDQRDFVKAAPVLEEAKMIGSL